MSPTAGRVFSGLTRAAFSRGGFIRSAATTVRLNSLRPLALSSQKSARPIDGEPETNNEPMKFTTSKASHRIWKVSRSMGSQHERPWWRVLPISLFTTVFLLWCALRGKTDVDTQLEKQLYERLPGLLSDEEEEVPNKTN